jgi:sirohydrochlorin cobaltochelatase
MKIKQGRLYLTMALAAGLALPAAAADIGIVVVAHGVARGTWNRDVEQRLAQLRLPWPMETGFLASSEGNTVQQAFDRLAGAGVRRAVVIPLLVSSHSSHVDEIRYYVGLGPKPEGEDLATPPVKTKLAVRMTGAIDYHPAVAAEFCARAKKLSRTPGTETVLLVGHGPNEEDNNRKWLDNFDLYARDLRQGCGFQAAAGYTLRDDAPAAVRDRATEQLRQAVAKASAEGGRAIVMPVLIGSGGVMDHITGRLKGLEFAMSGEGLIGGGVLQEWLVETAAAAIARWTPEQPRHAQR